MWVNSRGTHWNPGEWYSFGICFFPCRGGQLFSFGNDFTGPWGHTHDICSSFGQWYIALDQSFFMPFYFILMIPNYFNIMLWVFILPPKEGLFVINFMPFPKGFEQFLFITKNNSPVVSQGSTHRKQMISALYFKR